MKNKFVLLRSKGVKLATAILSFAVAGAAHADATLPTWATTVVSDASTQVTNVYSLVGPAIGISIAAGLVIKLIKRGAAKI